MPQQTGEANAELNIGDKMPDGTIYVGVSPNTKKPMYTTPADVPLTMMSNEAIAYAEELAAHGHQDWRVPTNAELNVLFNNRAAIGGFDLTSSGPAGWYWSAPEGSTWSTWAQRFSDGYPRHDYKGGHASLRCVR